MEGCGLDSFGSGYAKLVAGSCQHGTEPQVPILKCREMYYLREYQFLKNCAVCS